MSLNSTELSILAFFIVIGPLIFLHELGHFIAARLNRIRVEEFGIGYPPRMFTLFELKGTKYTLNWLPLGGFMRPAGEDDPGVGGGFASASKRARLTVLIAGPAANVLVAFILLVAMFMIGAPAPADEPGALVARIEPNSPAEQAGLQVQDIILFADDVEIDHYEALTNHIRNRVAEAPGEPIVLTVMRGSSTLHIEVTPRTNPPEGQGPIGIQIQSRFEIRQYGPLEAVGEALKELATYARAFVELPAAVIQQQIPARYLRPVSVIGISQLGGQAIDSSIDQNVAWPIIRLTAAISIALAITNLLPLPALDGGRILFILIEAVRGRRVDPQRETVVHLIGFAILVTTMLVFVYLDIVDPLVVR